MEAKTIVDETRSQYRRYSVGPILSAPTWTGFVEHKFPSAFNHN